MSLHPRNHFAIRRFIAAQSLTRLIGLFILSIVMLAAVLSIIAAQAAEPAVPWYRLWNDMFIELMGKEQDWSHHALWFSAPVRALLATLALIIPSLFFGLVVYKFFVLQKDVVIFRSQCELNEQQTAVVVHFYIASALQTHNVRIEAFVRTYQAQLENADQSGYPMNTIPLQLGADSCFPLPFSRVPSRVEVPIAGQQGGPVIALAADSIAIEMGSNRIELALQQRDFCQLVMVISGEVPDLQSQFREVHSYDLPAALSHAPLPAMITQFNRKRQRFMVENWRDF
ncbi:hypothetical protein [Pseudidiomarina mangrovi]|uniref:hypothetical protein n=1 Tax=Pseudidiomarina mangrovi TaxID=2487133 RepID=UPI000FC9BFDF|nr:hypothetical protein [Pseudidiomarina mangrovi]